jgi:hypothetical protein
MRGAFIVLLLLGPLAGALPSPAQETAPSGITCCDEQKIRAAMTEEALARIAAISMGEGGCFADYLSVQAYGRVRKILPAGGYGQRLACLRALLQNPARDKNGEEFQTLVGNFVLGMTLEIGHTFQDECDRAQVCLERSELFLKEMERQPVPDREALSRSMFNAGISEKELRRLLTLEQKWREARQGCTPFEEFGTLKKNAIGQAADSDQYAAFELAARYRAPYPFLDEFLEKYRLLATAIRQTARRIGELTNSGY